MTFDTKAEDVPVQQMWRDLHEILFTQIVTHQLTGSLSIHDQVDAHKAPTDCVLSVFRALETNDLGWRIPTGFRVRTVSLAEYAGAVRLRESVEEWAIRQAAGQVIEDKIYLLRDIFQDPEAPYRGPKMMWVLDDLVHEMIGNGTGNTQVGKMLVRLSRTMRLFSGGRDFDDYHGHYREDVVVAEHLDILEAVERGKAYEAGRMIQHHVQGNAWVKLGSYIR